MRVCDLYTVFGAAVAVAALVGGAAATAPGREVGLGAGRVQSGATEQQIEDRFGRRPEYQITGFAVYMLGRGRVSYASDRIICRGPLTVVEGDVVYRDPPHLIENVRVYPAVFALSGGWHFGAAVFGLAVAGGSRAIGRRRRAPAPAAAPN